MPTQELNPEGRSCGSPAPREHAALSIELLDPQQLLSHADYDALIREATRVMGFVDDAAIRGSSGVTPRGVRGTVEVRLMTDEAMAEAHLRYCGVAGTTDVITFDLSRESDPGDSRLLEVELLVCVDEARRQAAARGHDALRELVLYVLHGVLHCLGHDDLTEADARAMHECEDRVLAAAGLGAVFARPIEAMSPLGREDAVPADLPAGVVARAREKSDAGVVGGKGVEG